MSNIDFSTVKSLLHFEILTLDEIGIEDWSVSKSAVKASSTYAKFGNTSLYTSTGYLIGTNNTGIWDLNSSNDYEIEFFVYPKKHGDDAGTRRLLRLREPNNTSSILMLSLTTSGNLELTATGWNITDALTGITVLTIGEWHHVLIRVSNQTLKVFLNGVEEVSTVLPDNVTLNVDTVLLGYFSSTSYPFYIDEFVFRHSAGTGSPTIPDTFYVINYEDALAAETVKSLLHFKYLALDEIGLETWRTSSSNVKTSTTQAKFGGTSLYPNVGFLISTNDTGIWSLNSSGNYEIEFFVYPTAHGGNRYLFQLTTPTDSSYTYALRLSLNSNGTIRFASDEWGYSGSDNPVDGTTVLSVNEWHHVMLRISNQKATVFLNRVKELTVDLPEDVTLSNTQARVGYFSSTAYSFYIDEFVFRHSAGTITPVIPDTPYGIKSEIVCVSGTVKSLLHFGELKCDEISLEAWSKEKSTVALGDTAKFGSTSLYSNGGALIGTNDMWIWNLNSSGNYEVEFFVYPTAHGGNRYLFQLTTPTDSSYTYALRLSLNSNGTIRFASDEWGYSGSDNPVDGTTVLSVNEWHHIMLRIATQKAVVFLDGVGELSADLPEDVILKPEQARIGYFSSTSYGFYIDEFIFRHSAGEENPTIPSSPYFSALASKRNFGSTKCLLHFDFPYFNEPNDGLDDDVGIETWSAENTNVKLYGSEIPKAGTFAPKFGYRCLRSYNGVVIGTNNTGIWNVNSNNDYEIEFFVNLMALDTDAKHLFRLITQNSTASILMLSINNDGCLKLTATGWGINDAIEGTIPLTLSLWQHVLMRISGRMLKVFLDGIEEISAELPDNVTLNVDNARIGYFSSTSYPFYIDEFVFRHSAGTGNPQIPTKPYSGKLYIETIGEYGTGVDGDVSITEDTQINSYGAINAVIDAKTFSVSSWSNGSCLPEAGREVMIHITRSKSTTNASYPKTGLYVFSRITSLPTSKKVVIADEISVINGHEFTLTNSFLDTYNVQIITIPHYKSLTVSSEATITPLSWTSATGGGIVAFRVKGDCMIDGKILTHGYGAVRYDFHQMTNSKLIDRFLCSQGGGIYITCGGTFSAPSTARLGASWSGLGENGNGAAGYGGNGGSVTYSSNVASGGKGGIGGGGGSGAIYYKSGGYYYTNGGNVGNAGYRTILNASAGYISYGGNGGCGGSSKDTSSSGGSQGSSINGSAAGYLSDGNDGGAPGGNGGNGGIAGASIVLVCNTLDLNNATISTGGQGQEIKTGEKGASANNGGGGGTGFCYIACRKQVS